MTLDCRGLCKLSKEEGGYKFPRQGGNSLLYLKGAKRCQNCEGRYVQWESGIFCPCCGGRLRLKPRKSKLKEKVLQTKHIARL